MPCNNPSYNHRSSACRARFLFQSVVILKKWVKKKRSALKSGFNILHQLFVKVFSEQRPAWLELTSPARMGRVFKKGEPGGFVRCRRPVVSLLSHAFYYFVQHDAIMLNCNTELLGREGSGRRFESPKLKRSLWFKSGGNLLCEETKPENRSLTWRWCGKKKQ